VLSCFVAPVANNGGQWLCTLTVHCMHPAAMGCKLAANEGWASEPQDVLISFFDLTTEPCFGVQCKLSKQACCYSQLFKGEDLFSHRQWHTTQVPTHA